MSDKQGAPTLPPLTGGGGNNGGSNGGAPQQTVSLQQVFANVLTSANVQQFVLASQVPGLTQVIPGSGSSNQPIGVTRIVNLSGASPRVSVVNVSGTSATSVGSSLTSPSRQNPKLVLTTSPKLVRTSIANMFVTPATQTSGQSPPPRKKSRITDDTEKPTAVESDTMNYRHRIMEHKMKRMRAIREQFNENASELFFLHNGGNLMDYHTWKKRPPTSQFLQFMKQQKLESDDDVDEFQNTTGSATASTVATATTTMSTTTTTTNTTNTTTAATATVTTTTATNTVTSVTTTASQSTEVAISGGTPVAVSTTLPPAVAQLSQQGQVPGRPQGGRHGMVFTFRAAIQASSVTTHPSPTTTIAPALIIGGTPIVIDSSKSNSTLASNPVVEKSQAAIPDKPATPPLTSAQPIVKLVKLPASSIASSCDTISNQEQIVEKAKQEAYVMQRIAELQREGLWSERRLPKVQEPPRPKAHWDYLLEEMTWLSADFAQERKWKKSAAKKCARMVQKYFQEKAIQAQKAEKLEELRLKKIAGFIAKEVKTFWANVEKLVEYKQQTRLEEKRKKALDQHLNFIVDQTEKYSSWLTEGLNKAEGSLSTPASIHSSRISSPVTTGKNSDDDFKPNQCSDDDEETIAKAEEEMKSNHKEEVELLKKESELPLEDLLKELPPNYLEERGQSLSPLPREIEEEENDNAEGKDTEFTVASDESSDDEEDTIQEQEKLEKNVDHKQEIDDLKAENEMSIEELMAKYGNAPETPMDVDENEDDSDKDEEDDNESESENETESEDETQDESQTQSDEETAVGLKSLLEDLSDENKSMNETSDKQTEMDSVAALAESIQPKGNTLLTTSVVTKIPFLLKHCLREYQHIGLDWLVTMFERKLNGILADEMGLGKTIQTIALLAHLACEKGNWGPHLIIVPTSVMLNWEMECKKWCPGFKILTYYGTQKERKQKRTGWTKPNAFHICITSYKLVIQDHQSFRRKKWKYLILDEAQNIKNFKSQRWQLLLNFQTQRRLLLTGTPLQNNLMELWSLMHFLMPNVFQSHREFKEWFSNPVTGMIEGNNEYNENIIRRLHKVLRPFLLRRLKCEVEKQLPKKYEHVIMCRLSKRQRYLYDDFMSRAKTKETLASGNLLSVINVLMQLRKVCNHPNLFETRPTVSPFQMEGIDFHTASLAWSALDYDPFKHVDLSCLNLVLIDLEFVMTAFTSHRVRKLKTPRKLIEEIDSQPEPPPRCPSGKIKINVRLSNQVSKTATAPQQSSQQIKIKSFPGILPTPRVGTSPLVKNVNNQTPTGQGVTLKVAGGQQLQGFSVQLVPHQGGVKAIPVGTVSQNIQSTATVTPTTTGINAQRITVGNSNTKGLTTHTYTVKHGDSVQKYQVPSFAQLVQTSTGRHIILTNPNQQNTNALSFPVMTSSGQRLTVLSKQIMGLSTTPVSVNKVIGGVVTSTAGGITGRPVMRVPPLNVSTSQPIGQIQQQTQIRCGVVTRNTQKDTEKTQVKETPKSEFHLTQLEETRRQRRQAKLATIADINNRRCAACPLYGEDLFTALRIGKPASGCQWHAGWIHCASKNEPARTRRQYFSRTEALAMAIKSTEQIVEELKSIFEKFVVYVPAVKASLPHFHVSHPPPHKLWRDQCLTMEIKRHLSLKMALFHPVERSMLTQFPDARLIQYDCGKLQSLDMLLRELKVGNHRALIFTQMTRMLDVLEAFLNYHGYIYLRLDGATKIDQRQVLMERFNNDKRIFCFILSTRSGGVGVNLTGADTVVFYDSDWNPTMDAQAQDRCHRIGQTRDVHIYRLISERTVEENILKKANQKRLLGDLAIEGGNFTTAYFKSSTIQDLFNVDQSETDASARMAEVLDQNKDREKHLQKEISQPEDKMAIGALESALAAVEEDLDVQAAKTAKAEAVADLAEFDENIPVDDADNDDMQVSKAELEVQNMVSQLLPVERYAMRFVEESDGTFSAAQLAAAERELEEQKKEWELDRLRAMREEEERQARMTDDDENPITFTREDAQNQVNNSTSNSRRVAGRKPTRKMSRRGRGRLASVGTGRQRASRRSTRYREEEEEETSSESESDTTSLSVSDSQDEDVAPEREDSSGEEHKSSRVDNTDEEGDDNDVDNDDDDDDDDEEEDEGNDEDDDIDGRSRRQSSIKKSILNRTKKNHFDLNSPRTRSRGNVKINLWTLDVSPILPEKHRHRTKRSKNYMLDDSFAMPKPPYKDSSEVKTADVSMTSSADESLSVENEAHTDTSIVTSDTFEAKITRRSVTKLTAKLNLGAALSPSVELEELKLPNMETIVEKSAASTSQENESNECKETSSTTHRVGRPRKHSVLTAAATVTESNASVTYSTRSSNKLSAVRSTHEKRPITLKINYKESEICDINDTFNSRSDEKEAGESSFIFVPHDPTVRPNYTPANSDTREDNEETATTSTVESHEKSDSNEQSEIINNLDSNLEEEITRSASPILSSRKMKVTRSYARVRSESNNKEAIVAIIPLTTETQSPKNTDHEMEAQESSITLMETDDPASSVTTASYINKITVSQVSSSILNTRHTKLTRSAARSNAEIKDKQTVSETKEKLVILESKVKEVKVSDKVGSLDDEIPTFTVTLESENSPIKGNNNDGQKEHVKIKITRSTAKSIVSVKPKEMDEVSEKSKSSNEKIKEVENEIQTPSAESDQTQQSDHEEEHQQLQAKTKITRSTMRSLSESKSSNKIMPSDDTDSEQVKALVEKPILKHLTVDVSLKSVTIASEKSKSPERQTSTETPEVVNTVTKSIEVVEKIKTLEEQSKEGTISPSEKSSANDENLSKEQDSNISVTVDSKEVADEPIASSSSELKLSKTSKVDTSVSGVTTRRSKANCTVEVTPEATASVSSNTESKITTNLKITEPQIESSAADAEKQSEKSVTQTENSSSEQGRVTRSNVQMPNPLFRAFPSSPKSTQRRRPDTPMPVFYSIRPVTRSLAHNSGSNSDSDSGTSNSPSQKISGRSPRSSIDNGFLVPSSPPVSVRRSRSTTYIKMSDRLAMERKEIVMPTGPPRSGPVESLTINRVIAKRRPDTPLPTSEQLSRLGKSNMDFYMPSPRSVQSMPKLKHIRRAVAIPQPVEIIPRNQQPNSEVSGDSTDSNGNSLDSDIESPSHDKPQRTAKVVAILSLESKSSGKSHQQQTSGSPQRTKPFHSENALVNNTKSPRLNRSVHGSKISSSTTTNTDEGGADNYSVITMVDLDDEPECTNSTDATRVTRRVIKRTRLNSQPVKTVLSSCNKSPSSKDIQTIDIEDDEEEKIPLKRSNRFNPPPPASTISGPPDKVKTYFGS